MTENSKTTVRCVACGEPQKQVGTEWPTCRIIKVNSRLVPAAAHGSPANPGYDRPALSTIAFDALVCRKCGKAWQDVMEARQAEYEAGFNAPVQS